MVRVDIVTGFLGAGKTTWLARHSEGLGRFDAVIVNEAGEGQDQHALAGPGWEVRLIDGGCACCVNREALVEQLRELIGVSHRGPRPRVALEASGLADPGALLDLVANHPLLAANIVIERVVTLVNAADFPPRGAPRDLVRRQLATADEVVLSRTDIVDRATLDRVVEIVSGMSPGVRITSAINGVELVSSGDGAEAAVVPHADPTPLSDVVTISIALSPSIVWAEFAVWLRALTRQHGERVLRVKGLVPVGPGRTLSVHAVGSSVAVPNIVSISDIEVDLHHVVLIGWGLDEALVRRSLAAFVPSARY